MSLHFNHHLKHWDLSRNARIEQLDKVREVFMDQISREESNLDTLMRQIDERADAEGAGGSMFGAFSGGPDEAVGEGAASRDQAEQDRLEEARIRSVISHLNTKLDQIDELFSKVRQIGGTPSPRHLATSPLCRLATLSPKRLAA